MITETKTIVVDCRKCDHSNVIQAVNGGYFIPVIAPKDANKDENFRCYLCNCFCIKATSGDVGSPCEKCNFYILKPYESPFPAKNWSSNSERLR